MVIGESARPCWGGWTGRRCLPCSPSRRAAKLFRPVRRITGPAAHAGAGHASAGACGALVRWVLSLCSPSGTLAVLSWVGMDTAAAGLAPEDAIRAGARILGRLLRAPSQLTGLKAPFSIRFTRRAASWRTPLLEGRRPVRGSWRTTSTEAALTAVPARRLLSAPGPTTAARSSTPRPRAADRATWHHPARADHPPTPLHGALRCRSWRYAAGWPPPRPGRLLDAGSPRATLHRLYLEGVLRPGARVYRLAVRHRRRPAPVAETRAGRSTASSRCRARTAGVRAPSGVWVPLGLGGKGNRGSGVLCVPIYHSRSPTTNPPPFWTRKSSQMSPDVRPARAACSTPCSYHATPT